MRVLFIILCSVLTTLVVVFLIASFTVVLYSHTSLGSSLNFALSSSGTQSRFAPSNGSFNDDRNLAHEAFEKYLKSKGKTRFDNGREVVSERESRRKEEIEPQAEEERTSTRTPPPPPPPPPNVISPSPVSFEPSSRIPRSSSSESISSVSVERGSVTSSTPSSSSATVTAPPTEPPSLPAIYNHSQVTILERIEFDPIKWPELRFPSEENRDLFLKWKMARDFYEGAFQKETPLEERIGEVFLIDKGTFSLPHDCGFRSDISELLRPVFHGSFSGPTLQKDVRRAGDARRLAASAATPSNLATIPLFDPELFQYDESSGGEGSAEMNGSSGGDVVEGTVPSLGASDFNETGAALSNAMSAVAQEEPPPPHAKYHFPGVLAPLIVPDGWSFQHFIDGTLPKLALGWEHFQRLNATLLIEKPRDPVIWDMLDRMGIPRQRIALYEPGGYAADKLLYFCRAPPLHPALWQKMAHLLGVPDKLTAESTDVVVLKRTKENSKNGGRMMLNYREVLGNLTRVFGRERVLGFDPKLHGLKDTLRVFSKAAVIVATHGGAIFNQLFAPGGATVIEFMPVRAGGQLYLSHGGVMSYVFSALRNQAHWRLSVPSTTGNVQVAIDELIRVVGQALFEAPRREGGEPIRVIESTPMPTENEEEEEEEEEEEGKEGKEGREEDALNFVNK